MADLEIRVTSKNQAGAGFAAAKRDVQELKSEFDKVEKAAKIDAKVNADDTELDGVRRKLDDIDDEVLTPKVSPDVDGGGVEAALGSIEDKFAGIDLSNMGASVTGQITSIFSAAGPVGGVIGAAAAVFADDLAEGFTRGWGAAKSKVDLAIRTGLGEIELADAGRAAGEAWSAGFGESMSDLRFAAAGLSKELESFDLGGTLGDVTKEAQLLEDKFGIEIPRSVDIAKRMVANDMAPSVSAALETILGVAQRLPLTFDESLDVLTEYAPNLGKLNLSGAEMVDWLGDIETSGAFENVDKGADAIREFNTRLTETDELRDVIPQLGLDFEDMQRRWVAGGESAQGVVNELADALVGLEDRQQANFLAGQLFGSAVEDVSDRMGAVQALKFDDTVDDIAGSLDEATAAAAASQTEFDRLQRAVSDFAAAGGEEAAGMLTKKVDELATVFGAAGDAAEGAWRKLTFAGEKTEEVGQSAEEATAHFMALNGETYELTSGMDGLTGPVGAAAERFADLQAEAESTERALRSLSDWADGSGEAALRGIYDAASEVTGELTEQTAAAYDLAAGWDLTTAAGRAGSEMAQGLKEDVARVTDEFLRGEITSGQYQAALAALESALREAGAQAGKSEAEVDAFVDSVLGVPADTEAAVHAETAEASSRIANLNAQLDGIDGKTSNTYVNHNIVTYYRTVGSASSAVRSTSGPRAHGGLVGGGSSAAEGGVRGGVDVLVGEHGPEIAELPAGTNVRSNPDTMSRLSRSGAPSINLTVQVMGNVTSERDLVGLIRDEILQASI